MASTLLSHILDETHILHVNLSTHIHPTHTHTCIRCEIQERERERERDGLDVVESTISCTKSWVS
jgi:hypothetical protein